MQQWVDDEGGWPGLLERNAFRGKPKWTRWWDGDDENARGLGTKRDGEKNYAKPTYRGGE